MLVQLSAFFSIDIANTFEYNFYGRWRRSPFLLDPLCRWVFPFSLLLPISLVELTIYNKNKCSHILIQISKFFIFCNKVNLWVNVYLLPSHIPSILISHKRGMVIFCIAPHNRKMFQIQKIGARTIYLTFLPSYFRIRYYAW